MSTSVMNIGEVPGGITMGGAPQGGTIMERALNMERVPDGTEDPEGQ
jgi:hypothetical protein